jgi:RNA polymerase sigma factor for flagellar operon FliA
MEDEAGVEAEQESARVVGTREQALVLEHLPRARAIAYRLAQRLPATVDREELVQCGVLGLIDAARRYDALHACSFETYSEIRIRGAVLDQLRMLDWAPRSLRQSERELDRGRRAVEVREGRAAEGEEVASQLGLSAEGFERLRMETGLLQNAEWTVDEDRLVHAQEAPWSECEATNPLRALDIGRERQRIADAIALLPDPDREIVSLVYWKELAPEEVARTLALDANRVRLLHARGLRRLRHGLRELWG